MAVTKRSTRSDAMKMLLSGVLVLALVPLSACAPKVNNPADVQAVRAASLTWDKAWNSANAEAVVLGFYTADAARMDPNQPALVGQQAIRAASQKYFDQYTDEGRSILEDVRVSGDLAVARGTFEGKSTPKTGGSAAQLKDKFLTAFQRQADGSWRAFWDIYNSDLPMPGTTADGAEEQAVMQIERDWAAAMVKRDVAALDRILAKEWAENADGEVMTRAQALAVLKSGGFKLESVNLLDLSVHIFGDAAIATMAVDIKGTFMGKPVPPSQRSTDFFVKRDGRWQAVSTQNTTITE
jgi:uncharacterized protein (TIGR02246 family)